MQAVSGGAAMDTARFRRLIDHYLGDDEIARIAAEARKGRKLLISTTHLDAARSVVWDLTRIAASGVRTRAKVIGDLILASSTLPGVFRPCASRWKRAAPGTMNCTSTVASRRCCSLSPAGFDWKRVVERARVQGKPQVYVIRNARPRPYLEAFREAISPALERSASFVAREMNMDCPNGTPSNRACRRCSGARCRRCSCRAASRTLYASSRRGRAANWDCPPASIPATSGMTRTNSWTPSSCGRCSSAATNWRRLVILDRRAGAGAAICPGTEPTEQGPPTCPHHPCGLPAR